MQIVTTKPVTFGKKKHPVGAPLDVAEDTAKWLIAEKAAQPAEPEAVKPAKPASSK